MRGCKSECFSMRFVVRRVNHKISCIFTRLYLKSASFLSHDRTAQCRRPCWHAVPLTCKLKHCGWRWWRGSHGSTVSACCGADAGCRPPVQVCGEGGNALCRPASECGGSVLGGVCCCCCCPQCNFHFVGEETAVVHIYLRYIFMLV